MAARLGRLPVLLGAMGFLALPMPVPGQTYFANQSIHEGSSSIFDLDSPVKKFSLRFTQPTTKTIQSVEVFGDTATAPATYTVGIQADNSGLPSGVFLSSAVTQLPLPAPVAWQAVPLPPVSLTGGLIYHVVVQSSSADFGHAFRIFEGTSPAYQLFPRDQSPDPGLGALRDEGSGWTDLGKMPIVILDYDDGSHYGNPYHNAGILLLHGDVMAGEVFQGPAGGTRVLSVGGYFTVVGTPVGDLLYDLVNVSQGVTLAQGNLAVPAQYPPLYGYRWLEASLGGTFSLDEGVTYQLTFSCPGCVDGGDAVASVDLSAQDSSPYRDMTYAGTNAFRKYINGPNLVDIPNDDIPFRFEVDLSFTATPPPTSTPSPTPTKSPSASPTDSLTWTLTATGTPASSPSPTVTLTPTPSFTVTFSPTLTPSPSPSATLTPSATFTESLVDTESSTESPTHSMTASATATPERLDNGSLLLYPNPVLGGESLHLRLPRPAETVLWRVYDVSGELVARERSGDSAPPSCDSAPWAAGLYLVLIDIRYKDGGSEIRLERILVLK